MERLPRVTTSDLSRRPRDVLDRVARGERLIVCHRKTAVATLQPLDGFVFQPFDGTVHDVFGWPFGDAPSEAAKLTEAQRVLLRDCYRDWRLRPTRLPDDLSFGWNEMLDDLAVRGLAYKGSRGWELTGRGLALRETLVRAAA